MPEPWETPPERGDERDDVMPFPVGKDEMRVRSRGLPSQRGMERRCGILLVAIRRPLMVCGAGERPVMNYLTSPCVCACLWLSFSAKYFSMTARK
jgi:hypothetical protein